MFLEKHTKWFCKIFAIHDKTRKMDPISAKGYSFYEIGYYVVLLTKSSYCRKSLYLSRYRCVFGNYVLHRECYSCYKQTYRWQNNESQKLCENKLGQNAKDFQKTSVLFWSLQTWLQAKMPKSWITTRITTKLFSMRVVLLEKLLKRIQIALWKLGNIVNTTRESITRGSV